MLEVTELGNQGSVDILSDDDTLVFDLTANPLLVASMAVSAAAE